MATTETTQRTTTLKGNPLALAGPELKAGEQAPDFEAVDSGLQTVNLQKTGTGVRVFSVVYAMRKQNASKMKRESCPEYKSTPSVWIYRLHKSAGAGVSESIGSPCYPIIGPDRSDSTMAR